MTNQEVVAMANKLSHYCDQRTRRYDDPCKTCPLAIEYTGNWGRRNSTVFYECSIGASTPDTWDL